MRGDVYYQLLDEFLSAVKRRYGNTTLIHFSDMSYDNASKLLNMYRTDFPCFSDELQVGRSGGGGGGGGGVLGIYLDSKKRRQGVCVWGGGSGTVTLGDKGVQGAQGVGGGMGATSTLLDRELQVGRLSGGGGMLRAL